MIWLRGMGAIACLGFLLCSENSLAEPPKIADVYVASDGSDDYTGRLAEVNSTGTDGPFATLERARQEVRRIKQTWSGDSIRVQVREGAYELEDTFRLAPEDSGTKNCSICYMAYPGEKVILRGGRAVHDWEIVGDGVCRADLKSQGLGGANFHQLFYQGRRQILARHPNFDPQHPRTGGFTYVAGKGPRPSEQFIYEQASLPFEKWDDLSQAEIVTTYGRGWNFAIVPIVDVDTKQQVVTTQRPRRPFEPENRFYVQNVRAALDRPGEWYLDRRQDVLYFYCPDGKPGNADVVVPLIDHLVELHGTIPYPHGYLKVGFRGTREDFPLSEDLPQKNPVEFVSFKGFHFQCARQDAVRMIGARECGVSDCEVTNVGNLGINLGGVASAHDEVGNPRLTQAEGFSAGVGGGGQNLLFNDPCEECSITENDIWSVGSDGIFLYGTGNEARNNHVQNIGLFDKDCACINVFGEENEVGGNILHDVPRNAIFLKGSDNQILGNDICRTMLETCDGGAIRMCQRNVDLRGNVIEGNRIVDTVGYGYPVGGDFQSPYYSWGIYLDDFTCGTIVRNNLIVRAGRGGIHVHGGSDNLIEGNTVVDAAQYQFENNPIRLEESNGNIVRGNFFQYDGTGSYLYRCGRWRVGSVTWENNTVWPGEGEVRVLLGTNNLIEGWQAWLDQGFEKGSRLTRHKIDLPAFTAAGSVGPESQPSHPLRMDPTIMIDEQPILRKAPVRPLHANFEWEQRGRPPREGDVAAPSPGAIRVVGMTASSGKQCLEFIDAEGLPQRYQPRLFYATRFTEGRVRFGCDVKLDDAQPPHLVFDLRQYSETGTREYFTGPYLTIMPDGKLMGGDKTLATLPTDTWFRLDVTMNLGPNGSNNYGLAVKLPDGTKQQWQLPYRTPHFQSLERIVIMSLSDGPAVFYLDDVYCGPDSSAD